MPRQALRPVAALALYACTLAVLAAACHLAGVSPRAALGDVYALVAIPYMAFVVARDYRQVLGKR